ncbi:uncharacterized protein C8Q71DRAFT_546316 [Rhodofomes roseus]|uniref:Uncharacterized protein n=1 Tax=Rhodofomes roseus TaxID=34475 RepID=A0ABQ8KLJ9_9APHY|nr:uncharacterized protein C8Q71DRAFT_546316 [Rhodofomes roseus]KAH9838785.1 hypothetical protein C8Q71DRAFT_546316 [Rhodofomes roseus]
MIEYSAAPHAWLAQVTPFGFSFPPLPLALFSLCCPSAVCRLRKYACSVSSAQVMKRQVCMLPLLYFAGMSADIISASANRVSCQTFAKRDGGVMGAPLSVCRSRYVHHQVTYTGSLSTSRGRRKCAGAAVMLPRRVARGHTPSTHQKPRECALTLATLNGRPDASRACRWVWWTVRPPLRAFDNVGALKLHRRRVIRPCLGGRAYAQIVCLSSYGDGGMTPS